MTISAELARETGVVRDYDGSRPCICPMVLAKVADRIGLRQAVWDDNIGELLGVWNDLEEIVLAVVLVVIVLAVVLVVIVAGLMWLAGKGWP